MKKNLPFILLFCGLLLFFGCQDPGPEIISQDTELARPVSTTLSRSYFAGNLRMTFKEGTRFFLYLGVNLGNKTMGAFAIDIKYDSRYLNIITTEPPWIIALNSGLQRTVPGQYWGSGVVDHPTLANFKILKTYGYSSNGVTSPNSNGTTGLLRIAFRAVKALSSPYTYLSMRPETKTLVDMNYQTISAEPGAGPPLGVETRIYINP